MNKLISTIEEILRNTYEDGYGAIFLGEIQSDHVELAEFKEKIPYQLPNIFYDYYEWLLSVQFEATDITDKIRYPGAAEEIKTYQLSTILSTLDEWKGIKAEQPEREWQEGFVEIASWNGNYVKMIDTMGKVNNQPGIIIQYDFKGGGVYEILHKNFDEYLTTKIELLKQKLYFPPLDASDEQMEDFLSGETRSKIDALVKELNAEVFGTVEWQ